MAKDYGVWREDRGYSRRAIVVIDAQGIVSRAWVVERGLPDVEEILTAVRAAAS